jgi:hypothetical protein
MRGRMLKRCVSVVAVIVAIVLTSPPLFGAEPLGVSPQPATSGPLSRAAIDRAISRSLQDPIARTQLAQHDPAETAKSFLSQPKGLVVLAAIAAGFGYTMYSKFHDRVHSPNPDR